MYLHGFMCWDASSGSKHAKWREQLASKSKQCTSTHTHRGCVASLGLRFKPINILTPNNPGCAHALFVQIYTYIDIEIYVCINIHIHIVRYTHIEHIYIYIYIR